MQPPLQRQLIIGFIASAVVIVLIIITMRGPGKVGVGSAAAFSQGGGSYGAAGGAGAGPGAGAGVGTGSRGSGASGGGDGTGQSAASAQALLVDVAGAVRHPGVYELAQGARALDAIRLAGGVLRRADLTAINRAAKLVDGQQLIIPMRPAAGADRDGVSSGGAAGSTTRLASASGAAAAASPAHPVSLNSGSVADFDTLPGVGPTTAQKIVDDRTANGPFKSVHDLDRVSGIGPATIADLEHLVTP